MVQPVFTYGGENVLNPCSNAALSSAIFQTAAKIGAIVLARAVQDTGFSDEILRSVRKKLG
jgi:hypothetical protein